MDSMRHDNIRLYIPHGIWIHRCSVVPPVLACCVSTYGGAPSQTSGGVGEKRVREAGGRGVNRGAGSRTRLDPDELRASEGGARPREGDGNETRREEYERICKRRRCVYDSDDE